LDAAVLARAWSWASRDVTPASKAGAHGGSSIQPSPLLFVERDNADTDELRARNVLQSSRAGATAACGC
jgi:hypothetical protein